MKYYLYNPFANNGIKSYIPEGAKLIDASKINYPDFFAGLAENDEVVLIGGDGTINYLINHIDTTTIKNNVYLYGNGTGSGKTVVGFKGNRCSTDTYSGNFAVIVNSSNICI